MTNNRWDRLKLGDVLKSAATGHAFVVSELDTMGLKNGKRVVRRAVLVRTVEATNPKNWTHLTAEERRRRERL